MLDVTMTAAKILGGCIGNARSRAEGRAAHPKLEILLGLALLSFSEIQALLLLCSAGLERSARIHVRSLYEYTFRAKILLADDAKAERFTLAAIAELEKLAKLISAPPEVFEAAKARFLGAITPPPAVLREKKALGGDMRTLIKADTNERDYGIMFAYPSMFSHGSILALDEVSTALANVGNDFQAPLYRDGQGAVYLLTGANMCCDMAAKLVEYFGADAVDELEATITTIIALQSELGAKNPPPPPVAT